MVKNASMRIPLSNFRMRESSIIPLVLIYLSHTRLVIAHMVSIVSQFIHNPFKSHLKVVYCIICYLKGTCEMIILFQKAKEISLKARSDVSRVGSIDKRSTIEYYTFMAENLITWRSKK